MSIETIIWLCFFILLIVGCVDSMLVRLGLVELQEKIEDLEYEIIDLQDQIRSLHIEIKQKIKEAQES